MSPLFFTFISFSFVLYNCFTCTSFVHSSSARPGSSVTSSMIPPYQGSNARARDRVQALQAYYQQLQPGNSPPIRTPVVSGSRRSSSHRGMSQVGAVASSSDQTGFYFIPSGASGRNFQEAENPPPPTRFRSWERDHLPSFSLNQVDRDSGWSTFHQAGGGPDPGIRFRQRHGSERMSSQNRWQLSSLSLLGEANYHYCGWNQIMYAWEMTSNAWSLSILTDAKYCWVALKNDLFGSHLAVWWTFASSCFFAFEDINKIKCWIVKLNGHQASPPPSPTTTTTTHTHTTGSEELDLSMH